MGIKEKKGQPKFDKRKRPSTKGGDGLEEYISYESKYIDKVREKRREKERDRKRREKFKKR